MKLKDNFSSLYYQHFKDLLDLEVPDEKWADCVNCHFCANKSARQFYTKCCDYQPALPNYIVGYILNDKDPVLKNGKEIVLQQIKNKVNITPFGILPTTDYQEMLSGLRNNIASTSKEETKQLQCTYFQDGACSIHKHRSDVCGSFFCISVGLSAGKQFWEVSAQLNQFLDKGISMMVAEKMGFTMGTCRTLQEMITTIEVDKNFNHAAYSKTWGRWAGNEIDYFKQCYEVFQNINKIKIEEALGTDLSKQIEEVKKLHRKMEKHVIPEQLQFDEEKWTTLAEKGEINSIDLWLLRLFNGTRKTDEVIKKALLFNVSISKTIEKLMEKGILCEVK